MKYNPDIHHRRSVRLKDYDYSQAGLYFVTICCDERKCRFGRIENGAMTMNEYGIIAYNEWIHLTKRFVQIEMDVFQIMPNHMHGIIAITPHENHRVGATLAVAQNAVAQNVTAGGIRAGASPAPTIATDNHITVGNIVGAYKSLVSNACLKIYKSNHQVMGKLWQRNYYEHIIRDEDSYVKIAGYIQANPQRWEDDTYYA